MNHDHNRNNSGFTLIELVLAMGFVSALMLAIAMTVIQMGHIYNSGLTYKNVNQLGSAIAIELQRGITESPMFALDSAKGSIIGHRVNQAYGGRLCTGEYTYIWNNGSFIVNPVAGSYNEYLGFNPNNKIIRLIKIYDAKNIYCNPPYPDPGIDESIEMIDGGQYNIAIHDLTIETYDTARDVVTGQQLYNVSFYIGTNNKEALDDSSTPKYTKCKTPDQINSDPTRCFVSNFNFIVRAGDAAKNGG